MRQTRPRNRPRRINANQQPLPQQGNRTKKNNQAHDHRPALEMSLHTVNDYQVTSASQIFTIAPRVEDIPAFADIAPRF